MPRTETPASLFTPAKRRKIIELASNERATLRLGEIPDAVRSESRIESGISANGRFHEIFSIFVAPENIPTARERFAAAKTEMETLWANGRVIIEQRRIRREECARAEVARRDEIISMLDYQMRNIYFDGKDVVKFSGMRTASGQDMRAIVVLNPESNAYGNMTACRAYVTMITTASGGQDSVQTNNGYRASGREEAINQVVAGWKASHAEYLMRQERIEAERTGTSLPWVYREEG